MKISDLKKMLSEQISPLKVKKVMTIDRKDPSNSADLLVTYPDAGYRGLGTLDGGEEFIWQYHYNGSDWLFDSALIE